MKPKRTRRSRDYYRHQRKRMTARRIREVRDIYGRAEFEKLKDQGVIRSLENRHFFGCSCSLCKWEKKHGIEKHKYEAKMSDSLEEYIP